MLIYNTKKEKLPELNNIQDHVDARRVARPCGGPLRPGPGCHRPWTPQAPTPQAPGATRLGRTPQAPGATGPGRGRSLPAQDGGSRDPDAEVRAPRGPGLGSRLPKPYNFGDTGEEEGTEADQEERRNQETRGSGVGLPAWVSRRGRFQEPRVPPGPDVPGSAVSPSALGSEQGASKQRW